MTLRYLPLAFAIAALAGCGGGSTSSTTPPTPNASSSTISVSVNGTPTAGISVTLSTKLSNNQPAGATIASAQTNTSGEVTFTNLPPHGQICYSASYGSGSSISYESGCAQPFQASYALTFQ